MAYALFQTLTVQEIKDLAEACPEAKELVHSYCQFESGNLRKHQTELVRRQWLPRDGVPKLPPRTENSHAVVVKWDRTGSLKYPYKHFLHYDEFGAVLVVLDGKMVLMDQNLTTKKTIDLKFDRRLFSGDGFVTPTFVYVPGIIVHGPQNSMGEVIDRQSGDLLYTLSEEVVCDIPSDDPSQLYFYEYTPAVTHVAIWKLSNTGQSFIYEETMCCRKPCTTFAIVQSTLVMTCTQCWDGKEVNLETHEVIRNFDLGHDVPLDTVFNLGTYSQGGLRFFVNDYRQGLMTQVFVMDPSTDAYTRTKYQFLGTNFKFAVNEHFIVMSCICDEEQVLNIYDRNLQLVTSTLTIQETVLSLNGFVHENICLGLIEDSGPGKPKLFALDVDAEYMSTVCASEGCLYASEEACVNFTLTDKGISLTKVGMHTLGTKTADEVKTILLGRPIEELTENLTHLNITQPNQEYDRT